MKKVLLSYLGLVLILVGLIQGVKFMKLESTKNNITEVGGIEIVAKIDNKSFMLNENNIMRENKFKKTFLKGVNLGLGKPSSFPGEFAISKENYYKWFEQIKEMNSNVIRVYTLQSPAFYEALYEYNYNNKEDLYVIHGIWMNEDQIRKYENAYNKEITKTFLNESENIINAMHGDTMIPEQAGMASGYYKYDVSNYVIGWIVGIEWDPNFVINTNKENSKITSFKGKYVYTKNASPFECYLAKVTEHIIGYETTKYNMQRPTALSNWVTTDHLKHPNEPFIDEDKVSVNNDHIKATDKFVAGMFASFHVYPYYPDCLNYDMKYQKDKEINTYKAYIKELSNSMDLPILISEVGLPTSRGLSHVSRFSGYNQGNITEKQQGEYISSLVEDIYSNNNLGAIIFSWQDEWFKRSWNTMDNEDQDRRPFWLNVQTAEQNFGLLKFESVLEKNIDGLVDDWKNTDAKINIEHSENHLYILLKDYEFGKEKKVLTFNTISNQGIDMYDGKKISTEADFILEIDGEKNTRLKVDSYYDSFYKKYAIKHLAIPRNKSLEKKDSMVFSKINMITDNELILKETKQIVPMKYYETGKLNYGNDNSLADFYYKDGNLEIRIPWNLLNFTDPSSKKILSDVYGKKHNEEIKEIEIGTTDSKETIKYNWNKWNKVKYEEKLKDSYNYIKNCFENK